MPLRSIVLVFIVASAALSVAACGEKAAAANAPVDSGTRPGDGLLFRVDAAIFRHCEEAGAPTFDGSVRDASDASTRDAAVCIPSRNVSYENDVVPVFAANCSGEVCHNGQWGGGGAYEHLVDVTAPECCDGRKLVLPGDPKDSYLVQKLRGMKLCAGSRMPLDRKITDADIQTLTDWVCEGAPNR